MSSAPYSYAKVSAWMEIDGARMPIIRAQIDYELNAIPRAVVSVPLGRNAATGEPSPLHLLTGLTEPKPAKIYLQLANRFGVAKDFGMPAGPVLVFDGYTGGLGHRKSMSPPRAEFSFSLRHWLSELDYSSVFSRWSHPSNPARYSAGAIPPIGGTGAAGDSDQVVIGGPYDPDGNLDPDKVTQDLWEDSLKPFFLALCEADALQVPEQAGFRAGLSNDVGAAAVGRMRSSPSLKFKDAISADVGRMISEDLGKAVMTADEIAGSTIWGVTVGKCASEYLFAVTPRVSDALVVPFAAAARGTFKTITPDEYAAADWGGEAPRPIRAFGVMSGFSSQCNADGRPAAGGSRTDFQVGGWYVVRGRKLGLVRIENAPRWAAGAVGEVDFAVKSAPVQGRPIALAAAPNAAGPPRLDVAEARADKAGEAAGFLDDYARARLAHEQLVNRQGVVSGPLRLDVAPGSSLRVTASSDLFLQDDALKVDVVGTVLRTSITVDAEAGVAQTSFHLSHMRTDAENEADGNSLDAHPIYSELFLGAGLADA